MKRYKPFLEQEKDIDVMSQIKGIQDSIKKLEFQNKEDEIDMRYVDKTDKEGYNKKINDTRERMKGRADSIKVLQDRIQAIKDEESGS